MPANNSITGNVSNDTIDFFKNGDHLGTTISENGTFRDHLSNATRKASVLVRMITRNLRTKNRQALTKVWKSYIEPVLIFDSVLWNSGLQYISDEVDKICNKFWRLSGVTKPLNCLMPSSVMLLRDLQMCHKILNFQVGGVNPEDYFFRPTNVRSREYANDFLFKRRFDHGAMNKSFFQRVIDPWNTIDKKTRELPYGAFTKEVKKLLYNKKICIPNRGRYAV